MPPETTTIPSRIAACAAPDDDADAETYLISGDAIGAGDVTHGLERERKVWLAEDLQPAASTLEGQSIIPLHSEQEVGEVTRAGWDPETETVVWEAEITDAKLANQVNNGDLEVSIEAKHYDGGTHDATGAMVASDPRFTGLSLVQQGAAPSASAEGGPATSAALSARLSATQIQATLADDDLDAESLAGEMEGAIGAEHIFRNPNQAVGKAEEMGLDDIHEHDVDGVTVYMPGSTHDALLDHLSEDETSEAATTGDGADEGPAQEAEASPHALADSIDAGDIVTWNTQGDRPASGRVIETIQEGRYDTELSGDATVNAPAALIRLYRPTDDGWGPTDVTVAHRTDGETLDVVEEFPDTSTEVAMEAIAQLSDERAEPRVRQQTDDTNTDTAMTNEETPEDPGEKADPTELKAKLSDKTDRIESLESELADVREERDEYEDQADAVDEAEKAFAAALADHVPREADALRADLGLSQMRDWLDDIDEADVGDAATADPDPSVQSGGGEGTETATLSDAEREEKQELEARLAEVESKSNRLAEIEAERIEDELAELEA